MVLTILDYLGIRGSGDMTYSTPHGYRVEGAGSAEADGLYVREGEYAGAPLFKKGRLWLLRYRLRSGNASSESDESRRHRRIKLSEAAARTVNGETQDLLTLKL